MTDLKARLVAYTSAGARSRILPAPFEWSAALPLNDLPSLTVQYTRLAPGGDLLAGQTEVGLEVSTDKGTTWAEPMGGRFLATAETGDDADTSRKVSPQLKGVAFHLSKAVIYPAAVPTADNTTENSERIFAGATPGAILRTLLDEAHLRGVITPLTCAATSVVDSAGQTWPDQISLNLPIGQDLMTVLRSLSDQGMVDWTTQGRELLLYKPGTVLGRDKSVVILRTGRDTTEASRQSTVDDVAGSILLLGDDGATKTLTNSTAPEMFGAVWETTDSMAGVADDGSQEALGQALLAKRDGPRVSRSRQLALPTLPYAPLGDFRAGVTVTADGASGLEAQRIMQVTLSLTAAGIGCAVTLNDRFLVGDLRRDRSINQIRGTSGASGGNGSVPGPIGPDSRTPQQVTGVTASSSSYLDVNGDARSQITLAWARVTAATDGVAQSIAAYYIERRPVGGEWSKVAEVVDPTVVWTSSPYEPGSTWEFRVQALSASWVLGAFSATASATGAADTTAPPTPSTPTVSSRMGTVYIQWDGGPSMPADFARIDVAVGVVSVPEAVTGTLTHPGTLAVGGLAYGTTYYARMRAVDRAGNASAWSAAASFTVKSLVDTDLIGQVIDGANLVDGSITASDKIIANTITGDLIQANTIETDNLAANAIDGMVITGAVIQTAATGQRQVQDIDGFRAYGPDGTTVVTKIDGATGQITATGSIRTDDNDDSTVIAAGYINALHNNGPRYSGGPPVTSNVVIGSSNNLGADFAQIQFLAPATEYALSQSLGYVGILRGVTTLRGGYGAGKAAVRSLDTAILTAPTILIGDPSVSGEAATTININSSVVNLNGQPLTASPGSSSIHLARIPTIPIAQGGTGATNAPAALAALGAALVAGDPAQDFAARTLYAAAGFTAQGSIDSKAQLYSTGAYNTTTTAVANVYISSGRQFARSTSVRAAKVAIEDLDVDAIATVQALRPRTWHDRGDAERLADALTREADGETVDWDEVHVNTSGRIPGFIAEEIAEIPGADIFATRTPDGELTGVAYDRIPALHTLAIQQILTRLEALEGNTP